MTARPCTSHQQLLWRIHQRSPCLCTSAPTRWQRVWDSCPCSLDQTVLARRQVFQAAEAAGATFFAAPAELWDHKLQLALGGEEQAGLQVTACEMDFNAQPSSTKPTWLWPRAGAWRKIAKAISGGLARLRSNGALLSVPIAQYNMYQLIRADVGFSARSFSRLQTHGSGKTLRRHTGFGERC